MYHHLKRDDRVLIAALLRRGESQASIARTLGVHPSTVSRERGKDKTSSGYHACTADNRARKRRSQSKIRMRKIENDPVLESRIIRMLHPLVSPEAVAYEVGIVHETIYAWIARAHPELSAQLPSHGKKRRRYGTKRQVKQGWTKWVRPIDERPMGMAGWEGDTVVGVSRYRLLTHVERTSLYTVVDLIPDGTADTVHARMCSHSYWSGNTITYDRGSEFALWEMIERDTGALVYFAHPHHPWERGKNENTNGRLRRVFPKGFDFATITQRDVDRVTQLMNHTRRKSLSWRTPCEVFGQCCTSS